MEDRSRNGGAGKVPGKSEREQSRPSAGREGREAQKETRKREEERSLCSQVTRVSPAPSSPLSLHKHLLKDHANQHI